MSEKQKFKEARDRATRRDHGMSAQEYDCTPIGEHHRRMRRKGGLVVKPSRTFLSTEEIDRSLDEEE